MRLQKCQKYSLLENIDDEEPDHIACHNERHTLLTSDRDSRDSAPQNFRALDNL